MVDAKRSAPPDLTPAQRRVLAALESAWSTGTPVDNLDALCQRLALRSRGALHRHMQRLVETGWVAPLDRHRLGLRPGPRAEVLPPASGLQARPASGAQAWPASGAQVQPALSGWPDWQAMGVPLRALPRLGRIAAGAPLDAVFEDEPVLVPEHLTPRGEAYVLEVQGDSMIGDGILDGDLVVVETGVAVRPGEIAVLLVAGEGATLKRFRQEGEHLRLMASNPAVADRLVPAAAIMVQGRISGLMRRCQ